jgi:hypothetical protein
MAVDERNRLQLAEAAKRALGADEGITLMELLPPVGWADVATKQDLALLETRIDARFDLLEARFDGLDDRFAAQDHKILGAFERELRSLTWKLFAVYATSMVAVIGALVAVAKL